MTTTENWVNIEHYIPPLGSVWIQSAFGRLGGRFLQYNDVRSNVIMALILHLIRIKC